MKRATVGYKSTDIGVIPADWQVSAVGDLFLVDPENLPENTSTLLKIKYIAISDVEHGRLRSYTEVFFGHAPSRARKKLRKGDVLLSTVRPNLKSHYLFTADEDCFVCSTGFSVLRHCNSGALSEFIYQHLFANFINSQIERVLVGSNYPAIKSSDVKKLRIPLPNPSEQKAIATALSDVDGLIENIDRLIAKNRDVKTAAMQVLLTGKKRLAGFGDGNGTKKTDIGIIPNDWDIVTLGNVADIYQPKTIPQKLMKSSGYPVYGANNVIGYYDKFNHGTWQVLVACRGTCGTVNRTHGKAWVTGNTMVVNFDNNWRVDKTFAYYLLCQQDFSICITGSTQQQIVRGPLASFSIAIPQIKEQKAIANILSDMDSEIEALQKRLAKTKAIKIAMMQELLTGKTRLVKP